MDDNKEKKEDEGELEWQYQSVTETADSMHVSTGKLREWVKKGMIDAIRPGGKFGHIRVSLKSVKAFLDRHTTGKHESEEDNKPDG